MCCEVGSTLVSGIVRAVIGWEEEGNVLPLSARKAELLPDISPAFSSLDVLRFQRSFVNTDEIVSICT
jgi:hypothetical protein